MLHIRSTSCRYQNPPAAEIPAQNIDAPIAAEAEPMVVEGQAVEIPIDMRASGKMQFE